ncbi:MAG: hypothetical protein ACTHOD_09940 [Motilibacteraceae bacterium]
MSREVLGSGWSGAPGRGPGAPVELVDAEADGPSGPGETGEPSDDRPEPGVARRRARWVRGGGVPVWGLVLALLVGALAGWGAPRWAQHRAAAGRLDLELDITGASGAGIGSVELDATLTNAGSRPVRVTGGHVGPALLHLMQPVDPAPIAPGAKRSLRLLGVLGSNGDCKDLRGPDGASRTLPVVLTAVDADGRTREATVRAPDGTPALPLPLADALCPQPVSTPDAEKVVVSVGADGKTSVHLVLRLAAAEPVVVDRIDGAASVRPPLPARMEPNGTLALDLTLPAPQCPDSGAGFPPSGLSVNSQVVGQSGQQGSWVDLGPDYVAAMVKFLARCPDKPAG